MATSGAQPGNRNSANGKDYKQAIKRALSRISGKDYHAGLDLVADALLKSALRDGEIAAIKEIGDRFDGKPHQSMDVDVKAEVRDASSLTDDELALRALSAGDTTTP